MIIYNGKPSTKFKRTLGHSEYYICSRKIKKKKKLTPRDGRDWRLFNTHRVLHGCTYNFLFLQLDYLSFWLWHKNEDSDISEISSLMFWFFLDLPSSWFQGTFSSGISILKFGPDIWFCLCIWFGTGLWFFHIHRFSPLAEFKVQSCPTNISAHLHLKSIHL